MRRIAIAVLLCMTAVHTVAEDAPTLSRGSAKMMDSTANSGSCVPPPRCAATLCRPARRRLWRAVLSAGLAMLAVCASTRTARPTEDARADLRVISFNIRYGTAEDGENHWDRRKEFLVETIKAPSQTCWAHRRRSAFSATTWPSSCRPTTTWAWDATMAVRVAR